MISDIASSHVVSSAKVGKSRDFSTLGLSNMTLVFLLPNVTSVVQPLSLRYNSNFPKFNTRINFCGGFCPVLHGYVVKCIQGRPGFWKFLGNVERRGIDITKVLYFQGRVCVCGLVGSLNFRVRVMVWFFFIYQGA
jgi:hypothetical protein